MKHGKLENEKSQYFPTVSLNIKLGNPPSKWISSFKNNVSTCFSDSQSINQKPNVSYWRKSSTVNRKLCLTHSYFSGRKWRFLAGYRLYCWIVDKGWYWVISTIQIVLLYFSCFKTSCVKKTWQGGWMTPKLNLLLAKNRSKWRALWRKGWWI